MGKHPLGGFHRAHEENEGRREANFEEKCVRFLLGEFGLTKAKTRLSKMNHDATGSYRLTFRQFSLAFPSFPVYLAFTRARGIIPDCSLDKLWNRFHQRKIVKLYAELLEEIVPEEFHDRVFGLVMKWPYVSRGVVLYDCGPDIYTIPGTRVVWTPGPRTASPGGAKVMSLEPFKQFLADHVGDWTPDEREAEMV